MTQVLCLDFGTSSVRAVLRDNKSNRKVIPLGQVTARQDIDGASIPSAFCIDHDLQTVRFGQHARDAIVGNKKTAYSVTSPKQWLTEPRRLDEKLIDELPITRRDVLTGLMGYALFAATQSGLWKAPTHPDDADIRIAHPVWPSAIKTSADQALGQIAWMAVNMAAEGDWGVTSIEVLRSWTNPEDGEDRPILDIEIDTIEPIAAAVELLPNIGNERRICMVVDVGAGTTDIGVFQYLSPDSQTNKGDKLIPAGPTSSVFKAGDEIDRVVLKLLRDSYTQAFDLNEARIKSEIRFQKEGLFKNGQIQVSGLYLALDTLTASEEIQAMAKTIRLGVEICLQQAQSNVIAFSKTAHLNSEITVVMAGGGADLNFLRDAISQPYTLGGTQFNFKFVKPATPKSLNLHGAGYERLAVGLGGAQDAYEHVVHEHAALTNISSLGAPKQVVSTWS
jgi:molecular chaperone HscA